VHAQKKKHTNANRPNKTDTHAYSHIHEFYMLNATGVFYSMVHA